MTIDWGVLAFPKAKTAARKRAEQLDDATRDKAFRDAVWARDAGRDRATGAPLVKALPNSDVPAERRGEVCHLRGRRVMPEWRYDPARAILLSAQHHELSDARGGRLLRIVDAKGLPATDATKPLTFIRLDRAGRELWRRTR